MIVKQMSKRFIYQQIIYHEGTNLRYNFSAKNIIELRLFGMIFNLCEQSKLLDFLPIYDTILDYDSTIMRKLFRSYDIMLVS